MTTKQETIKPTKNNTDSRGQVGVNPRNPGQNKPDYTKPYTGPSEYKEDK